MTSHLVAISIGPVQDFILAARRTRDLWFGSHVLSELGKAAAKALHETAAVNESLIFPAVSAADMVNVEPQDKPGAYNVGNVVLTCLPAGVDPKQAIRKAREATRKRWLEYATKVRDELGDLIDRARWDAQVKDVIEFYAASVPLADESGYKAARDRVMRLLAGRKACRDFVQPDPQADAHGVPKSALDGARASVWSGKVKARSDTEPPEFPPRLRHRIRAAGAEQLDAVGLVKRLGGDEAAFPSIPRIAADSWLRGAARACPADFAAFLEACRAVPHLPKLDAVKFPQFKDFPCDGALVFEGRLREIATEVADGAGQGDAPVGQVRRLLKVLVKDRRLGEPEPYLAVLAADGDRIGAALSKLESAAKHREFSRALSGFADEARKIVQSHCGCTIYAGGDDVLALVPVDQVPGCARELHEAFEKALEKHAPANAKPTLSVGVALGHSMDPMEDLLEWARAAEKAAKGKVDERDGLAVHLHTRGGAPVHIRGQWADHLDKRLVTWAQFFRDGTIPDKAAYDLQLLARDYLGRDGKPVPRLGENAELLVRDVMRLFQRKKERGAGANLAEVENLLKTACRTARYLLGLANELVVARRIARAMEQAGPRGSAAATAGAGGRRPDNDTGKTALRERRPRAARGRRPDNDTGKTAGGTDDHAREHGDCARRTAHSDGAPHEVAAVALPVGRGRIAADDARQAGAARNGRRSSAGPAQNRGVSRRLPAIGGRLYLPAPADAVVKSLRADKGGTDSQRRVVALRPVPLKADEFLDFPDESAGLWPTQLPETEEEDFKPDKKPAWWSVDKLADWLLGKHTDTFRVPEAKALSDGRAVDGFWGGPEFDDRMHVSIEPQSGRAADAKLYKTVSLALTDSVRLSARVGHGGSDSELMEIAGQLDGLHPLGGDRKLARWQVTGSGQVDGWECPKELRDALPAAGSVRMVLATPALFAGGWKPGWLNEDLIGTPPGAPADLKVRLVGASIERWLPLSGFGLEKGATGPKVIRRLVPAGGVYFFEVTEGTAARLADRWLESVCDQEQDRLDGFGLAAWGIWNR